MQKVLAVLAVATMSSTLPHLAMAQSSPHGQSSMSIRAQVKSNLEQAGYTNIRVMADSFLVRATDKAGNPVMMVINPDSVTAITDMSADEKAGNQGKAGEPAGTNAVAAANSKGQTQDIEGERIPGHSNGMLAGLDDQAVLNLNASQRTELWKELSGEAKEPAPTGFMPKIGEAVPGSLRLQALPGNVSNQVPAVKSYEFAMVQSQLLIVNPASKKIVSIIAD